jgi:hypothetical protein
MLRADAEEAKARGSDFAVDPRAFGCGACERQLHGSFMRVPHGIVQSLKRMALRCERGRSGDMTAGAAGSRCGFAASAIPGTYSAPERARRSNAA